MFVEEKLDEILREIKEIKQITITKISYITIECLYDYDYSYYKTVNVYTNPSEIPYLKDEYDEYFTEKDLENLEIGKSIDGRRFRIIKSKIN